MRARKTAVSAPEAAAAAEKEEETWGLGLEHEFFVAYGEDPDDVCPAKIFDTYSVFQRLSRNKGGDGNGNDAFVRQFRSFPQARPGRMIFPYVFRGDDDNGNYRRRKRKEDDNELVQSVRARQPLLDLFLREPLLFQLPSLLPLPAQTEQQDRDAYSDTVARWQKDVVESLVAKRDGESASEFDELKSMTGQALTRDVFFALHSARARERAGKVRERLRPSTAARRSAQRLFAEYVSGIQDRRKEGGEGGFFIRKGTVMAFVFHESYLSLGAYSHVFEEGGGGALAASAPLRADRAGEEVAAVYGSAFLKFARFVLTDPRFSTLMSDDPYQRPPASGTDDSTGIDGDFIEVKSTKHRNATVDGVLAQVKRAEDRAVSAAVHPPPAPTTPAPKTTTTKARHDDRRRPFVYPYSGVVCCSTSSSSSSEEIQRQEQEQGHVERLSDADALPTYAGSYHVWITLPHVPSLLKEPAAVTGEAARLARCHALAAHRLQWVEPLLMSAMSGDPRALGAGLRFPRASMRSTTNPLSGFGTTDVTKMLYLDVRHLPARLRESYLRDRVGPVYFDSVEDALRSMETSKKKDGNADIARSPFPRAFSFADEDARRIRPWINIRGEWVLDHACFNVERMNWGGYAHGATLLEPHTSMDISEKASYTDVLRKRGALYAIQESNDIRVVNCGGAVSHSLRDGWSSFWVRVPRAPGRRGRNDNDDDDADHFVLYFVKDNNEDGRVSGGTKKRGPAAAAGAPRVTDVAPIDEARTRKNSATGFEFRVPDNCPSREMREVLRFICLVAASAVEDEAAAFRHDTELVLRHIAAHRPAHDRHWNEALVDVSTTGCFVPLSDRYVRKVYGSSCFVNLSEKASLPPNGGTTGGGKKVDVGAFERLSDLARHLHEAYADHPVYASMTGAAGGTAASRASDPPQIVNRNFMAWKSALARHPVVASSPPGKPDKLRYIYHALKKTMRGKKRRLPPPSSLPSSTRGRSKGAEAEGTGATTDGDTRGWEPDFFYLERLIT